TNALQIFSSPVNSILALGPTLGTGGVFQPSPTFPSLFGSQSTAGTVNSIFGTGFDTLAESVDQELGLIQPAFGTGIDTGVVLGVGSGIPMFGTTDLGLASSPTLL